MKRISLLKFAAFTAIGSLASNYAIGQQKENIAGNLGGTRFVITAPAGIAGVKKINYATWGGAASPTISNMAIEKAYDTLGAFPLLNGTMGYPALTGKFALIYRGGGYTFSQKVNYCIAKGAVGVIIVNNTPGDPVGMGATPVGSTVAVPVLMISDVDGQAISDIIKTSPAGTAKLTLGTWNTGGTRDLGLLTNYQAAPHALNIPLHQLAGSAGTVAYKNYIGGAVANYGTTTQTGITVTDSVYWTPTAGATTYTGTKNSYTVPSVSVMDSIRFGFGATTYELTPPATNGRYEHRYSIAYGSSDDFPQDNMGKLTQNVTDSIFCKGSYDFVNSRPFSSLGIRPGTTTPISFMMGNMFYVKNGGYAARKVQFSLSHSTNPTLDGYTAAAYIMKWTDGVNVGTSTGAVKDSFIQSGEVSIVGVAGRSLNAADSSGRFLTLNVEDPFDAAKKSIILDGDSWYFIGIDVPADLFIGVDESVSYFSRSYAQFKNAGSVPRTPIFETPAGIAFNNTSGFVDYGGFSALDTNLAAPYPFAGSIFYIDSVFYDRFNEISAIALHMSKNKPTSIIDVAGKSIGTTNVYPNPAVNGTLTVEVALAQKSKNVVYRLTDLMGRSIYTETHKDIQNEKFEINTAKIASGNYFLMILTDDGFQNKKITILN